MLKKKNLFKIKNTDEACGTLKVDELTIECSSNHRPSRHVCDRGDVVSDMANMFIVADITVEFRSPFRPDHKGKTERIFLTHKENQNV